MNLHFVRIVLKFKIFIPFFRLTLQLFKKKLLNQQNFNSTCHFYKNQPRLEKSTENFLISISLQPEVKNISIKLSEQKKEKILII